LNEGLKVVQGEIISFTDDDSIPHADWTSNMNKAFCNHSNVGAVGGRDFVYRNGCLVGEEEKEVGLIKWYGRIIGKHHAGFGQSREADHLKGANMSFRKEALQGLIFDPNLRGQGAEYRNDFAICLAVKQRGWKILYDPEVKIDHYYSVRYDDDQRGIFNETATIDLAHNEMYTILKYIPGIKKITSFFWSIAMGNNIVLPGLALWLLLLLRKEPNATIRFKATTKGKLEGVKTIIKSVKDDRRPCSHKTRTRP
jgi:GT2 family glycosyltransferase